MGELFTGNECVFSFGTIVRMPGLFADSRMLRRV